MIPIINELSYFLPPSQDFIPKISKFIISQSTKHEGWSVEAENISIPTLSTSSNQDPSSKSDSNPRSKPSKLTRVPTSSALPFSSKLSSKVLQGPLSPTSFNPNPNPSQTSLSLSATWLWSTRASEVKAGEVTAVKPVSNQGGLGAGKAFENEKVIMLLSSSPLVGTALGLTLSKTTGLRVLLVNTPINDQEKPFPFALHEALSAWAYLIDRLGFQPENVTLAGDSIGAGLCLTLHLYLSCLLHLEEGQESLASLGRPTKLLLHSPRCDHTFQSPSFTINQDFDIINPQDCKDWSRNYLSSVSVSSPSNAQDFEKTTTGVESLKEIAREVLNSVNVHGKYHPFFGLGLPSSENRYIRLACKLFGNVDGEQIDEKDKLKVLITVGTHEVVVGEGRVLAKNLTDVENVLVQYVEGKSIDGKESSVSYTLTLTLLLLRLFSLPFSFHSSQFKTNLMVSHGCYRLLQQKQSSPS